MAELFDMYDIHRKPLGHTHPRGMPIREGEYHIVVQVCVLDKWGRLLLTQRHPDKTLAKMWEVTAGSVLAGEDSVTGAMRELFEETGLRVEKKQMILLFTRIGADYFLDSYVVRLNQDGESMNLVMQEGETIDYIWADAERQNRMEREKLLVPITIMAREYL